jgi:hypothetical protein
VCSWQFSRAAVSGKKKGKDSADVGLEDIGYSDAIGQLSSVVLGLFDHESPETMHQKLMRLLKGRSGETGEFHINWNFKTCDFSEAKTPAGEGLAHV